MRILTDSSFREKLVHQVFVILLKQFGEGMFILQCTLTKGWAGTL